MPTKSLNAWQSGGDLLHPGSDETSSACGEPAPKTVGMSVAMFSSTVFAVATWPTSQPARVNGTHGAGAFSPFSLIISGVRSVWPVGGNGGPAGSNSGAVQ